MIVATTITSCFLFEAALKIQAYSNIVSMAIVTMILGFDNRLCHRLKKI